LRDLHRVGNASLLQASNESLVALLEELDVLAHLVERGELLVKFIELLGQFSLVAGQGV
jgi:hypothetical protein